MSSIELSAMKVHPQDQDLDDAWLRITDLEGEPIDDETFNSMVELASSAVGGNPDRTELSRKWGSVKAWAGPTLVDVLWQGQAVNIYYEAGVTSDDQFYATLDRLRAQRFTIADGTGEGGRDWTEVPSSETVAEMAAAQIAHGAG